MSKPSAPKSHFPAGWIVAVVVVAVAAVLVAAPAKSNWSRNSVSALSRSSLQQVSAKQTKLPVSTSPGSRAQAVSARTEARVHANFAALPLAFEANQGQHDSQVMYSARGNGYKLFLTSSKAVIALPSKHKKSEVLDLMMNKRRGPAAVKALLKKRAQEKKHAAPVTKVSSPVAQVQMNFLGANPNAQLAAEERQPGVVNYYLGNDRSKWRENIPLYGRVSYKNVYPGVDLAFHGAASRLEFDYLVAPGASAAPIALGIDGAKSMHTNEAGDLVLATTSGPVQLHKPVAYQLKDGARQIVPARFVLKAKNEITFALGSYDHSRELVIDPTVTYATYFGGDFADYGMSIATDPGGNAYVAGASDSDSIPGPSGTVPVTNAGTGPGFFDVFVTKLNSAGVIQFTTVFGGSTNDLAGALAVDGAGVYVTGTTDSIDFPVTVGQQNFLGGTTAGDTDAWVVTLGVGGGLSWGTFVAGSDSDAGLGITVDNNHNVYVVGDTYSNDMGGAAGGVNALPNGSALNLGGGDNGVDDGFIVKLNAGGASYALISYIGGSNGDLATGVDLGEGGNIYVSGETISTDLPVTSGAVQTQCGTDGTCNGGLDDAFVVSIANDLSGYNYETYFGGSDVDDAQSIKADGSGNVFVTGNTASSDFPTSATPFQGSLAGSQNAFAFSLVQDGSAANYSTYLGGSEFDIGLGIAVDSGDNAYITGQTSSSDFPVMTPTQATLNGTSDAFVTVLNPSGAPQFSTFLGGELDEDQGFAGIAVDSNQNIYVTGDTDSTAFPTVSPADPTYGGASECFDSNDNQVPCTDAFIAAIAFSAVSTPDFTITTSAATPGTVAPGSSATSTVTIGALGGFTGDVTLSCSVAATPAKKKPARTQGVPINTPTCSFSSNPVTGGSGTSTLTLATTADTLLGSYDISVTGTAAGGLTHTASPDLSLTVATPVPDFTIAGTTPTAISPGSSGTSTVTLTSVNGYASPVNVTCAVTALGMGCSVATSPVTPTTDGATTVVTITTTASTAALVHPSNIFYAMWMPIIGLSLIGMRFSTTSSRRKKLFGFLLIGMVMAMLFILPACGGSNHSTPGCTTCTPAGNYTVTITGTGTDANTTTHTTTINQTVN